MTTKQRHTKRECPDHGDTEGNMFCHICGGGSRLSAAVELGRKGGASKSAAKRAASVANGRMRGQKKEEEVAS